MDQEKNADSTPVDPLIRAVMDGCGQGLCLIDDLGRAVVVNLAAERLFGCREKALSGRPLLAELGLHPASVWPREPQGGPVDSRGVARWRRPDGSVAALRVRIGPASSGEKRLALLRLEPVMMADGPVCDIESDFGAILDAITDGVIVIDELGIIQLVNPAAERMFGYRRTDLIGCNVKKLMPSPYREEHDGYLEHYRRTGERKIIGTGRELVGQRKDGTVFPLHLSIGELVQGGRRTFVGILHDLTARRQAEDRLLILSRAVDQSPVGIMITDLEGKIVYVNQGFSRLTGYSAGEVIGKNPHRSETHRAMTECCREMWERVQAGEEWHGEIEDRKKTGERYWALQTVTPIRDATGKVARFLAMQQDITQQKRDREALQESEERFRQTAELVGEWLWEQDSEGRYTYSSAAVREILGYPPEEIIGKHYLELMTELDRQRWTKDWPTVNAAGPFHKLINRYRHRNGHEVYTESTGTPLYDAEGRIFKWRGMDLDITARKRFEDALRLRDRAIEAASVGIAIADVRQPNTPNIYVNPALCRITGYSREEIQGRSLRLLQGPETDEAAREKIRRALREGTDCEVVIKNYRKDGTAFWNELLLSPVRDETGELTHYIGIQTDVTERRRAEEERHELEIARQIQLSLLPKAPLRLAGIEVAGLCVPASHVGGDYFDFFHCGDNVDLVIADVSGHSVGAALIMAEMRSTLKAEIRRNRGEPPATAEILSVLNDVLHGDLSGADLFITMFYLRYETPNQRLRYANAGHNRVLLLRRDMSGCTQLDADGLILGIRRDVAFEERSLILEPGDRLLLYTDGVTEAQNEQGEFFGLSRLCNAFSTHHAHPPEILLQVLLDEVRVFRGKRELQDDISMVAVQVA